MFGRDTLAFANDTKWIYTVDERTGRQITRWCDPVPDYTLRCFVLARAVKQFFLHARFDPRSAAGEAACYRSRVMEVLRRDPRVREGSADRVEFPGYAGLHDFSKAHSDLLKREMGGAWRSYLQRGNWRMVLPVWRGHQAAEAAALQHGVAAGVPQALHVFRFPQLTINHAMLVYEAGESAGRWRFQGYDPNSPEHPLELSFDAAQRQFHLPPTHYFKGGPVEVYRVYRNWCY